MWCVRRATHVKPNRQFGMTSSQIHSLAWRLCASTVSNSMLFGMTIQTLMPNWRFGLTCVACLKAPFTVRPFVQMERYHSKNWSSVWKTTWMMWSDKISWISISSKIQFHQSIRPSFQLIVNVEIHVDNIQAISMHRSTWSSVWNMWSNLCHFFLAIHWLWTSSD